MKYGLPAILAERKANRAAAPIDMSAPPAATGVEAAEHIRNRGSLGLAGAYTTRGQLVGHISIGISNVSAACELLGVPTETAMLVEHMLLAHHGQSEFGSPKPPMFPEAEVLAELDLLDSKMYEMFDALESVAVGSFSERLWALDNRQLYRHGHGGTRPAGE